MQQLKGLGNQEAIIAQLLKQNPQLGNLTNLLRNGQSLEGIAKTMAQAGGYDINQIISQLSNI